MKKHIPGVDDSVGAHRRYGREYYGEAFIPVPGAAFSTPFGYPGEMTPYISGNYPHIPSVSSVGDRGTEDELSERILEDAGTKARKKDKNRGI